ncbi:MAG TPA: efflux RND transporter permease subunit [Tepidisphaeraceae bacterium]|nr:efflux RND transporter permease subunit [Tepidisphaeraceae bacterium]
MIEIPSISAPFISRPVGTTLLTAAVALAGALAYFLLPVAPIPQVDFPTIAVSASLPGASPETMASAVATPLEREFGRIASVTEMTSNSTLGNTSITLQFDLNRDINAAARDVQAAINAAAGNLPSDLPSHPNYQKVNPADAPILILSITSDTYDKAAMYDVASSILQQKLSQVKGVGQVNVGGGASKAVRVDVNPDLLNSMNLSLEDVRTVLNNANVNSPKGQVSDAVNTWSLGATDQLLQASEYRPLLVAYRNGAAVKLSDIADVTDSVQDVRTDGLANGKPAILLIIFRQPGANIIDAVDRIKALMPELQAEMPAGMKMGVVMDRTGTIRASVREVQFTLSISVILVILVVFAFLRDWRATLIPSVAVPVSLVGTFGVMYLAGYSVDNLSLVALTIVTGFVVDDAIVVIENITRHLEAGMNPMQATLLGAREIGFTVVSMSASLVAVFLPILLMGGLVGRLFREFAVVLSVAIGISLLVSLTTTPMMCARILRAQDKRQRGWLYRASEATFDFFLYIYRRSLAVVLDHPRPMIIMTGLTVALTVYFYIHIQHGLFPEQDTGRLSGQIIADQDTSFQAMDRLLHRIAAVVNADPAVSSVIAFTGGGRGGSTTNTAHMFVTLKDISIRKQDVDVVMARLRRKLSVIPGATLYLQAVQDLRVGGRSSAALYQYTLQSENLDDLLQWAPKLLAKLEKSPKLADVNSDQQNLGLQSDLVIDRDTAMRMGVTPDAIDATLYDAFGQEDVSTMYTPLNQYYVVMEVQPQYLQNQDGLRHIYVRTTNNGLTPLSAVCHLVDDTTFIAVNHQGQFPSVTISFNLLQGASLSDAVTEIDKAKQDIGMPSTITGSFQGTAQVFQSSLAGEPLLIAAAILAVYIVLGMLYESYVHPITILSTIPSAGVGALVALMVCHIELDIMGLIAIILLIGIVKKNAIMMIDFALDVERRGEMTPRDAIFKACQLRFRPIMMTTMAALLGALPLALRGGTGSELRRPLGIAIVGGLLFSQALTLYTTPVIYLYLDRFRLWTKRVFHRPQYIEPVGAGIS